MGCYKKCLKGQPQRIIDWDEQGSAKIVLKIFGEETLRKLQKDAENQGLPSKIIQDAGRTQIAPGSYTCCAIGPGNFSELHPLTGKLKLL